MAEDKGKHQLQFNKTPEEVLRRRKTQLTAEQQAARDRIAALKANKVPLGGAPPVRIPPLDAEPVEGFRGTMADQAAALRDPTNPLSPMYEPQLAMMASQQHPLAPLPPEAAQQPGFRQGVGSMFAANQPGLQGQQKAPPPPKPGEPYRPTLSRESQDSLKALAEFHEQAQRAQEASVEENKGEKTKVEAAKAEKEFKEGGTDKDFVKELKDLLNNPQEWNALNNAERRKAIESRCKAMDIADILLHGEVRQEVPIRTGDKPLVVVYRSVSADEDLSVKRLMYGETGGDRYLMDKYAIMNLALALVSINGEELPTHLTDDRKFDEKRFDHKYNKLLRFPIQFLADLGIQYQWFDERVRGLFVGSTEAVKNS